MTSVLFFSRSYDPGFVNTAPWKSSICDIDGTHGKLSFRGYSIEDLVEHSSFVEVSYLLIFGCLPDALQLSKWTERLIAHSSLHTDLGELLSKFRYDAHPCGMFISAVAALGTFYPEANPALRGDMDLLKNNIALRDQQLMRILGKLPSIAAQTFRHRIGRPYNLPATRAGPLNPLDYTSNFLFMMDRLSEGLYAPHPELVKSLDQIWILHAEHGLNCSTATMRQLASTGVDPYTAVAGATAALYGSLHGGANEQVLKMLQTLAAVSAVPAYLKKVKKEKRVLFGFGHRVYKSPDPRAVKLKEIAKRVFSVTGEPKLWPVALELERLVLEDEFFVSRHLFPNVDFYSGIIFSAMDIPPDYFPVMFAVPLTAGWLAHWVEQLNEGHSPTEESIHGSGNNAKEISNLKRDPSTLSSPDRAEFPSQCGNGVVEPKQIYIGPKTGDGRTIIPIQFRSSSLHSPASTTPKSGFERRRQLGTNYDTHAPILRSPKL